MGKLIQLNKRNGFSITNKTTDTAEIVIYSQIGESWFEDGITAVSFSKELKDLSSSIKNITLRLNSPGGDVFDGITIHNRLKQHSAKVTVYIDGLAASIASIIALAGDEVIMSEGAMMMIHKPTTGVWGNSEEMESVIQRLDDVEEQLIGIYKRKTKLDRTEIKTMLSNETWMGAEEALELGFIDSTMASEDTLDIAACAKNAKWIKKLPVLNNSKLIKEKINILKSNVDDFLARK